MDQLDHPCGHAEAVEAGRGPVSVRAGFGEGLAWSGFVDRVF